MPMTSKYTTYEQLPLMLSVPDVAAVLGISRAAAYELAGARTSLPCASVPGS